MWWAEDADGVPTALVTDLEDGTSLKVRRATVDGKPEPATNFN
jgi:hypothetical protein